MIHKILCDSKIEINSLFNIQLAMFKTYSDEFSLIYPMLISIKDV